MRVRSLSVQRFMQHDSATLVLPSQGTVVITGPNGSGKSSLIEGVAWAGWGKTLRGTSPERLKQPGCPKGPVPCVSIVADEVEITRNKSLQWSVPGAQPEQWDTKTKAQTALTATIGSFDLWRRSCVLSSADVAGFAAATDAERKRLLETMLGADRLDAAHKLARADLRERELAFSQTEHSAQRMQDAVTALREREADARYFEHYEGRSVEVLQRELAAIERVDRSPLEQAQDKRRDAAGDMNRTAERFRAARQQADAVVGSNLCPTCTQPVGADVARKLADAAAEAEQAHVDAADRYDALQAACNDAAREVRRREQANAERVQLLRTDLAAAEHAAEVAERVDRVLTDIRDQLKEAQAQLHEVQGQLQASADALEQVRLAEQALGTRGARSLLSSRVLGAVEAAANMYLTDLSNGTITIKLSPVTRRASGKVAAAVDLQLIGAGGGHGYAAASQGERRRIDVALVLALADVAAGFQGSVGTLWLDEVFDSLDADGIEGVARVLDRISQSRCVVVITHVPAIAEGIGAVQRVRL